MNKRRIYVEQGIYIIVNNGKISGKCFEVAKRRKFHRLPDAIRLFKILYNNWSTVYMYDTKEGYMVEFKGYTDDMEEAIALRNKVEAILEVLENEKE